MSSLVHIIPLSQRSLKPRKRTCQRWTATLGALLSGVAASAAVIPPDDMFFPPLSLVPAVYPIQPISGDGTTTPFSAAWTTVDILSQDPARVDITITGVQVLPVLVPNPSPESEEGEYTAAELGIISVANYPTFYAQRPGVDLLDPGTDYVGDLTSNVLTLQFAAPANYVARVTTTSRPFPAGPLESVDYVYSLFVADYLGEDGARYKQKATRKGNLPDKDLFVVSNGDPNDNGFCTNAQQTLTEQGKPVVGANSIQAAKDAIRAKSQELGRKISVTMIGHGRPGSIKIGTERINKQADSVQSGFDFGRKIAADCSSVSFFSCNTAQDATGQTFLQNVANGLGGSASGWVDEVTAAASSSFLGIRIYDGYFDVESGGKKGAETAVDCNGNGLPDGEEIGLNPLLDVNENGTLDVCEQDYSEFEPNENRELATPVGSLADGNAIVGMSLGGTTTPGLQSADYYLVQPAPRPRGIYRHRLYLNSPTAGHIGTIRGLAQSAGVIDPASDVPIQFTQFSTAPPNFNQWYGFGRSEPIFYRVDGTPGTVAPYTATLETVPVTPVDLGTFPWGQMTISTVGQNPAADTEVWVYGSDCRPIRGYGNDDAVGTQSSLTRPFNEGEYFLAISTFNMANHLASPPDDAYRNGSVLDFAGPIANSNSQAGQNLSFTIMDAEGAIHSFSASHQPYDVRWFQFRVAVPTLCLGDLNGDGQVSLNDLTTLLSNFGNPATPEQGDLDGDGSISLTDLTLMLSAFGTICT